MSMQNILVVGALLLSTGSSYALIPCEVARVSPSDETSAFGWSVGISGDYLVVGAPGDGLGDYQDAGAVYVFKQVDGRWIEQVKLFASDRGGGNFFGAAVAIDGDVMTVGAPGAPWGGGTQEAYVFRHVGETWSEEQKLSCTGSEDSLDFGESVGVSGDLVVVGSSRDVSMLVNVVCVFRWDGESWVNEATLAGSRTGVEEEFGNAVAVDANRIVVGAEFSSHAGQWSGEAYVFVREGDNWVEEGRLAAPDARERQFFGSAVSIDGTLIALGAPGDNEIAAGAGAVYVFRQIGKLWSEGVKLIGSEVDGGDNFGTAVCVEGDLLLVGAPEDELAGPHSGSVYVFSRWASGWAEMGTLISSGGGLFFGSSLSVDDQHAVAGIEGYVYALPGTPLCVPCTSRWASTTLILGFLATITLACRVGRRAPCMACGLSFAFAVPVLAQQPRLAAAHHPTHLIVRFNSNVADSTRLAVHATAQAVELKRYRHVNGLTLVDAPGAFGDCNLNGWQLPQCWRETGKMVP